jgi:hypothetical protein
MAETEYAIEFKGKKAEIFYKTMGLFKVVFEWRFGMKVLVSDNLGKEGIEILKKEPGIEVDVKTGLSPAELQQIIGGYHALAVRSATK